MPSARQVVCTVDVMDTETNRLSHTRLDMTSAADGVGLGTSVATIAFVGGGVFVGRGGGGPFWMA